MTTPQTRLTVLVVSLVLPAVAVLTIDETPRRDLGDAIEVVANDERERELAAQLDGLELQVPEVVIEGDGVVGATEPHDDPDKDPGDDDPGDDADRGDGSGFDDDVDDPEQAEEPDTEDVPRPGTEDATEGGGEDVRDEGDEGDGGDGGDEDEREED